MKPALHYSNSVRKIGPVYRTEEIKTGPPIRKLKSKPLILPDKRLVMTPTFHTARAI